MTPIEKNISVVDELGNEYEATYPKRAKGLVKNGRARFVSENRICLACPPDKILEDNKMTDIIENTDNKNTDNVAKPIAESNGKYSLDYALEQIEKISASTAHLDKAMIELSKTKAEGPDDIVGQAKAQAIADVVRCRETTNQKLLDFYIKIVDELNPKEPDYTKEKFKIFDQTLAHLSSAATDSPEVINDTLDTIRQIFKENFPIQR